MRRLALVSYRPIASHAFLTFARHFNSRRSFRVDTVDVNREHNVTNEPRFVSRIYLSYSKESTPLIDEVPEQRRLDGTFFPIDQMHVFEGLWIESILDGLDHACGPSLYRK